MSTGYGSYYGNGSYGGASLLGYSTNMPIESMRGYYAASAGTSAASQPPSMNPTPAPFHESSLVVRPDGTRGLFQPYHGFGGAYADPGSYGRHGAGYPYTAAGHAAARGGYRGPAVPPPYPHGAHLHPEPLSTPPTDPSYGAVYGQVRPFKGLSARR